MLSTGALLGCRFVSRAAVLDDGGVVAPAACSIEAALSFSEDNMLDGSVP